MSDHPELSSPRRKAASPSRLLTLALGMLFAGAGFTDDGGQDEVTASIQSHLEGQFRAVTGLGFTAFQCTYPRGWPGSREILCDATDEENDELHYRLLFLEGEAEPRSAMKQPVDQLNPEGLATLSVPSDAFLQAFAVEDWNVVLSTLSPPFQQQVDTTRLAAVLAPLKAAFGNVTGSEMTFYATPSEGLHQLDYSLATDRGEAAARFRLSIDESGQSHIVAFLVTADPGSLLHAQLLEETTKTALAQFFDEPIREVRGPLDELIYIGDMTEVDLVLDSGRQVRARLEQHGSTYDTDNNDYRFQVLDVQTLIGLHLASTDRTAESIDCPAAVVPDGGSLDCVVKEAGGTTTRLRLLRRGGEHRLVDAE